MTTPTPLPDLEQQLLAVAAELDASETRSRRRFWRHGWSVLGVLLAATGTSVAVARVAHVGPFAYLDRYTEFNPKLAPTAVVTVDSGGENPRWQARAHLDALGQLCITGGPRDPRENPLATPTETAFNNPPQSGMTCADSDEIAQAIVDPAWPGATFAGSTATDGDASGNRGRVDAKGRFIHEESIPPSHLVVYAVAQAGQPAPVVRWYGREGTVAMRPSKGHLQMPVDKTPEGLDPDEQALVATYPDSLDLVLWAAEVAIPDGPRPAQVMFPAEFVPHGVDDRTVEVVTEDDMNDLAVKGRAAGWNYVRHISRDPRPVAGPSAAQKRWIAAFTRDRRLPFDGMPTRLRKGRSGFERQQFGASRHLSVVGGGVDDVWLVPGGLPETVAGPREVRLVCLLGSPVFGQCKNGAERWKKPMLEAVSCSSGLSKGDTLVWALTPPGAASITVSGPGAREESLPAGELLAVRRPVAERVTSVTWTWRSSRKPVTVRVPWPERGPVKDCADREAWKELRRDSAGSYSTGGRPPGSRNTLVVPPDPIG